MANSEPPCRGLKKNVLKKGVMNMGIKLFHKLPNHTRNLEKNMAVSGGIDILPTAPYI
jgi:hypothetical protein